MPTPFPPGFCALIGKLVNPFPSLRFVVDQREAERFVRAAFGGVYELDSHTPLPPAPAPVAEPEPPRHFGFYPYWLHGKK